MTFGAHSPPLDGDPRAVRCRCGDLHYPGQVCEVSMVAKVPTEDVEVDMDAMLEGYIECALWACTIPTDEEGTPVDPHEHEDARDTPAEDTGLDLSDEARKEAKTDCEGFVAWCREQCPEALAEYLAERDASSLGHDFHLSRNGHGAGFFDRGIGACDDVLQEAAKTFGSHGLMADGPEGPLSFHG